MSYTPPTADQIDDAVNRMLDELGYWTAPVGDNPPQQERNELALRIADSLPGRIHRAYAGHYAA